MFDGNRTEHRRFHRKSRRTSKISSEIAPNIEDFIGNGTANKIVEDCVEDCQLCRRSHRTTVLVPKMVPLRRRSQRLRASKIAPKMASALCRRSYRTVEGLYCVAKPVTQLGICVVGASRVMRWLKPLQPAPPTDLC